MPSFLTKLKESPHITYHLEKKDDIKIRIE